MATAAATPGTAAPRPAAGRLGLDPTVEGSPDAGDGRHDDIAFLDGQRGWIVNTGGEIHRTDDGGATWELLQENDDLPWRALSLPPPRWPGPAT